MGCRCMIRRYEQFTTAIARIYHQIQRVERDEMGKYGLRGPHAQCLVTMCRFRDGITVSALCEACGKDKAAVSRAVAELEQKGLLVRQASGCGSYRARLLLTDEGWRAARKIVRRAEEVVQYAGQDLSDPERVCFYQTLRTVSGRLHELTENAD